MSQIIKIIILLNFLLIMGMNICFGNVETKDFSFQGLNILSAKDEDIIAKMGEPKRKNVDDIGNPALTHLLYRNTYIKVYNDTGKIAYIKIEDRDYKTVRGISVGATPYKVVKEYGQPEKVNVNGHIYYVYKLTDVIGYRLMFDMTDGFVGRIIFTNLKET